MDFKHLTELWDKTSFAQDSETPKWDGLEAPDEDGYTFIPQGSHLGNTLIALDDNYEESGADCLFIQGLIAAFRRKILDLT